MTFRQRKRNLLKKIASYPTMTYEQLAEKLNHDGVTTLRGLPWSRENIYCFLRFNQHKVKPHTSKRKRQIVVTNETNSTQSFNMQHVLDIATSNLADDLKLLTIKSLAK